MPKLNAALVYRLIYFIFGLSTLIILTIHVVTGELGWNFPDMARELGRSALTDIFTWDWQSGNNFFKQFIAGIFTTLVIVGMDQDQMQKNLTCKTLREARKNMTVFSFAFIITVFLFLCLGALLYLYAGRYQLELPARSDDVYPWLAFNHLGTPVAVAFLVGVIAAAYSSADSALTSLTTTLSYDFLSVRKLDEQQTARIKVRSHLMFSFLLIIIILIFRAINDQSVVIAVFRVAGYTYGPILGLFLFGLLGKRRVLDRWVPLVALLSPLVSYLIDSHSETLLGGYSFGFELLILNGLLMVTGLWMISRKS